MLSYCHQVVPLVSPIPLNERWAISFEEQARPSHEIEARTKGVQMPTVKSLLPLLTSTPTVLDLECCCSDPIGDWR
jgi:hypothetical protein